jgi:hypothetical protein
MKLATHISILQHKWKNGSPKLASYILILLHKWKNGSPKLASYISILLHKWKNGSPKLATSPPSLAMGCRELDLVRWLFPGFFIIVLASGSPPSSLLELRRFLSGSPFWFSGCLVAPLKSLSAKIYVLSLYNFDAM